MELGEFTLDPLSIDENAAFPNFGLPKVVGYFSGQSDGSLREDFSMLKYIHIPRDKRNVRMDLNEGLHLARRKTCERKPLNTLIEPLLWWIKQRIGRLDSTTTSFVSYRGLLRQIMTTPYENKPWEILAMSVNGVTYLCGYETEEQFNERFQQNEKQKKFMSWGYKFEQFVLSDEPGKPPDTSQPVDEREEFCCLFKSKLGNFKILYGAEMDGVVSKDPVTKSNHNWENIEFVEIKTNRFIETSRQQYNFERYKLLNWWCQSYLVGIKNVICGFRDDSGIVHELKLFPIKEMHHHAKGWKPNVCMNFCKDFLTLVQNVVSSEKENSKIVWRFIWKSQQPITVIREFNNDKFVFLPEWFLDIQKR